MNDQAKSLRHLLNKANSEKRDTKVIAVVSGKGGVGKSNFSINFSLELIEKGKKVLLFDLDIGMANVDILMGTITDFTVVDMIEREIPILDIITNGPGGLDFIAGGTGFSKLFQLDSYKLTRFLSQLEVIDGDYDFIIFDMGAGATKDSLNFILSANEIIVVTTPEPTSVTDAYSMVKVIQLNDPEIPVRVLINRADTHYEGEKTYESLKLVSKQFLKKEITLLGIVPDDPIVNKSVKLQKPFILNAPTSKPSLAIKEIVSKFIGVKPQNTAPAFSMFVNKVKKYFQSN